MPISPENYAAKTMQQRILFTRMLRSAGFKRAIQIAFPGKRRSNVLRTLKLWRKRGLFPAPEIER